MHLSQVEKYKEYFKTKQKIYKNKNNIKYVIILGHIT